MATRAQNLDSAIDAVVALIQSVAANPKPTYTVGDKTVQWETYLKTLTDQLEVLEKARQRADGAFEIRSRGRA